MLTPIPPCLTATVTARAICCLSRGACQSLRSPDPVMVIVLAYASSAHRGVGRARAGGCGPERPTGSVRVRDMGRAHALEATRAPDVTPVPTDVAGHARVRRIDRDRAHAILSLQAWEGMATPFVSFRMGHHAGR